MDISPCSEFQTGHETPLCLVSPEWLLHYSRNLRSLKPPSPTIQVKKSMHFLTQPPDRIYSLPSEFSRILVLGFLKWLFPTWSGNPQAFLSYYFLTLVSAWYLKEGCAIPKLWLVRNLLSGLPRWLSDKELTYSAGDSGMIPWSGRFPGGGNGNPLQYSCLEIPMNRGAWQATAHGVAKEWTQLSD